MLTLLLILVASFASVALAASSSSSTAASTTAAATTAVCTAWNYTVSHNTTKPAPLDLGNTATNLPPSDDAVAPFNFDFTFTFYGQPYTSVNVSTNGNLQFISSSIAWIDSSFPLNLSTPQPVVPVVAPYYVDLNPDQDWMQQTAVLGTAPNRRAVIRYNSVPVCPFDQNATHNDTANDTSIIDAQPAVSCDVTLYEIDPHIDIHYYDIDPTPWPVSVGVQGSTAAEWTAAVDHQVMDDSVVQWLANSTLTFMPVCSQYQYQTIASTGRGSGPGSANGAALGSEGWSLFWLNVVSLIVAQFVL